MRETPARQRCANPAPLKRDEAQLLGAGRHHVDHRRHGTDELTRQSWQAYMPLDSPLSVRLLGFPDLPQPGVPNSAQRFIEHRSWTEVKSITTWTQEVGH